MKQENFQSESPTQRKIAERLNAIMQTKKQISQQQHEVFSEVLKMISSERINEDFLKKMGWQAEVAKTVNDGDTGMLKEFAFTKLSDYASALFKQKQITDEQYELFSELFIMLTTGSYKTIKKALKVNNAENWDLATLKVSSSQEIKTFATNTLFKFFDSLASKSMSVVYLAKKANLSRNHIYLILNNKTDVRTRTLEKLAEVLEVDISYFFGVDSNEVDKLNAKVSCLEQELKKKEKLRSTLDNYYFIVVKQMFRLLGLENSPTKPEEMTEETLSRLILALFQQTDGNGKQIS